MTLPPKARSAVSRRAASKRVQIQLCVSTWNFVSHVKLGPKEWVMGGAFWAAAAAVPPVT